MNSFSDLRSELEALAKRLNDLVIALSRISVPAEREHAKNHLVNLATTARDAISNYLLTHLNGAPAEGASPLKPLSRLNSFFKGPRDFGSTGQDPEAAAKKVAIHDQQQNFLLAKGCCGISSIANLFSLACPDLVSNLGGDLVGIRRLNSHLIQAYRENFLLSPKDTLWWDGASNCERRRLFLHAMVPPGALTSTWSTIASLDELRTAISDGRRAVVGVWMQTLIHEDEVVKRENEVAEEYEKRKAHFMQWTEPTGEKFQRVYYEDTEKFEWTPITRLETNHAVVFMGFKERKGLEGVVLADTGGWNRARGSEEGVVFWAPIERFQEAWKGSANYVDTEKLGAYCSELLSTIASYQYDRSRESDPDVLNYLATRHAEMN